MKTDSIGNEYALEVVDLVRYYGDLLAVDHLSLSIKSGEIFGFLGPNGAGKTTSIRIMCGLLKPSSGTVHIQGKKIDDGRSHEVRSRVGICPQENILWSKLTCFEQLVFSARMYNVSGKAAKTRALELLERMGLESKQNKLAATLSGGMKRRMNVILAMMHDPDILVFDEPEAGLDPQSRVMVREFLKQTARTKTVIFTTHNMDEADRIADRVAIVDSGRLLKLDTPAALKRSIGKGDVLSLSLVSKADSNMKVALAGLKQRGFLVTAEKDLLMVRGMDLIPRIHEIYQVLEQAMLSVTEMKVRENTLEDVFIQLTGKSLRQ